VREANVVLDVRMVTVIIVIDGGVVSCDESDEKWR
jgi:hypothetical protein